MKRSAQTEMIASEMIATRRRPVRSATYATTAPSAMSPIAKIEKIRATSKVLQPSRSVANAPYVVMKPP